MAIVGYNIVAASAANILAQNDGHRDAARHYTAIAGDQLQELYWYGSDAFGAGTAVQMALYTVVASIPATRVHAPVTIPVTASVAQWWSQLGLTVNLVAGTTYCVCWWPVGTLRYQRDVGGNDSRDNTGAMPAAWTETGIVGRIASAFGVINPVTPPAPSIYRPCCAQLIT